MQRVGRISVWLRVSGALASFPGSAQAFCITLSKVISCPCATNPLLSNGFPFYSTNPLSLCLSSVCLTCWDCKLCEVQTASDFWSHFVWTWLSLIWFVSVCTGSSNLKQSLWVIPQHNQNTQLSYLKLLFLKKKNQLWNIFLLMSQ